MEISPEIQLGIFMIIFGSLATVKSCRITAIIILSATFINLVNMGFYNYMSEQGAVSYLIAVAMFDLLAGYAILHIGDAKRVEQAFIFGAAVICHSIIGIESIAGKYFVYHIYEELIIGLNVLQIVVMWGCYGQLYGNIKGLFTSTLFNRIFNFNRVRVLFRNSGVEDHKEGNKEVAEC